MIAAWMLYALVVGVLLGAAAAFAERAARARGLTARFVWLAAVLVAVVWPAVSLIRPVGSDAVPAPTGDSALSLAIDLQRATTFVVGPTGAELAAGLDAALLVGWGLATALLLARLVHALYGLRCRRATWRGDRIDDVAVRVSPDLGPAVVGLRSMEIVLPEWTLALDRSLRAMVLCHEEEHRKAGDPYLLLVSALLVAVMPWNLALRWQVRRLRLAIEMDCDARVLRAHPMRERYGRLLLTIAQKRAARPSLLVPSLSESTSHLERRIIAMRTSATRISRARSLVFGTVAAAAIALACSVQAPDETTGPQADVDSPAAQPLFEFQVEKPAIAVHGNTAPRYPDALRASDVEGELLVQFVVDTAGRAELSTFEVLRESDPLFTEAVKAVLPGWRFHPAEADGRRVRQVIHMPFRFMLQN